jgi:hypothetical protein
LVSALTIIGGAALIITDGAMVMAGTIGVMILFGMRLFMVAFTIVGRFTALGAMGIMAILTDTTVIMAIIIGIMATMAIIIGKMCLTALAEEAVIMAAAV